MLLFVMLILLFIFTVVVATIDYYKFKSRVSIFKDSIIRPEVACGYDLHLLDKILGDGEGEDLKDDTECRACALR